MNEEFLTGYSQTNGEQPCAELFHKYRSCLDPALRVMGKSYAPEELLKEFPIIGSDK